MRKILVSILPILFCLFSFVLFPCCDKTGCNGDLDGQWQMTRWTLPSGEVVGGKELKIYYSFQLQMMMFQRLSTSEAYQLSSFENHGDHIRVYDPTKYQGNGHDSIMPMSALAIYGVPADGIMRVDTLAGSKLVLSSQEQGTLTFRKY